MWSSVWAICAALWLPACRQTVVWAPFEPLEGAGKTGYADAISNIAPCVVSVHTRTELTDAAASALTHDPALRRLFKDKGDLAKKHVPKALVGLGSGVVISKDGYILTSGHVIEGADKILVTTSAGEDFNARVVGNDESTDIAVLKIESKGLPVANLADSSRIRVGDIVLAIGNPFGVGQTVTSGIISGTGRDGFGIADFEDFIQTDASINPGNSGGALVDSQGRVVGISIAILSSGGGFEGIGLAVPINLARNVMTQLMTSGKVVRGYLGATLDSPVSKVGQISHASNGKGAFVAQLAPGSPAERAGIQQRDVIVEFNGKQVENDHNLRMQLAEMSPGTSVQFRVRRGDKTKGIRLTLGQMPNRPFKEEPELPVGGSEEP